MARFYRHVTWCANPARCESIAGMFGNTLTEKEKLRTRGRVVRVRSGGAYPQGARGTRGSAAKRNRQSISNDCNWTGIVTLIVPNMPWPGAPWISQW